MVPSYQLPLCKNSLGPNSLNCCAVGSIQPRQHNPPALVPPSDFIQYQKIASLRHSRWREPCRFTGSVLWSAARLSEASPTPGNGQMISASSGW